MKQLLQYPGGRTRVAEVPAPSAGPGSLLVQTGASVVSVGTERMLVDFARKGLLAKARARPDLVRRVVEKARTEGPLTALEQTKARMATPMPLGYSSAGTVVAVGPRVHGFTVGDRVACAGQGHAEVVAVPVNLAARVPAGVPWDAAAFATVGAIGLHGLRLSEAGLGDVVAVIGLGVIGLLTVQMARAAGCRVLSLDLDPVRVRLAAELGAERSELASDTAAVREAALDMTSGRGIDVALVTAATESSGPLELAADLSRDRGRVVAVGAVGLEVPRRPFYMKELDLRVSRSYGPGRYDPSYEQDGVDYPVGYVRWTEKRNLGAFLELVSGGDVVVDALVTHRVPFAEAESLYDSLAGGGGHIGVVLEFPAAATTAAPVATRATTIELRRGAPSPSEGRGLGLIGAGLFATSTLVPAILKAGGFRPVGVVTRSGLSGRHAGDRFGFGYASTDLDRLLTDPAVDLVAIATRHHLHAAQVVSALRAGKHVFVEKPLALTPDELRSVECAAAESGRSVMVGFNRRFAPLMRELAGFVRSAGPLTVDIRVNAGAIPAEHWVHDPAVGGGRIVGEACHFVDVLSFLAGAPPVRVYATAAGDGGLHPEDRVQMVLALADGSTGSITYESAGDRALGKERYEVHGGARSAILDDFRTLRMAVGGRVKTRRSRLRQDKGHVGEWRALRSSLEGASPVPLEEAAAVTRATFAAVRSLGSGAVEAVEPEPPCP